MANDRKKKRLYTNNDLYYNSSEKMAWIISSFQL